MRLDLFLKSSRLMPRRPLAQRLCEAGHVKINNAAAKPAKEVRPGDLIELRRGNRLLTIKIKQLPETKQVSRSDAAGLYEVVSEEVLADMATEFTEPTEENK